ncbi:MAG: DNA-binding response regulator [Oligoflexia bacterium]|nr:MAG: DNA-binding response regulator [Oligoflexia bacterium]
MRILIVEDQIKMALSLQETLSSAGYQSDAAESISSAQEKFKQHSYDLILLDVMLPDGDGYQFAQYLRDNLYQGPILMLTALSTTRDKVQGLDAGADDYLTKPYSQEELLARVRALLRRKSIPTNKTTLKYADLEMNLIDRKVKRGSVEIVLTAKEFSLLEYFIKHPEQPLTRSQLTTEVWNVRADTETNVVDVYINLLRKKIDQPFSSKLIHTVVGVGYVLRENSE